MIKCVVVSFNFQLGKTYSRLTDRFLDTPVGDYLDYVN